MLSRDSFNGQEVSFLSCRPWTQTRVQEGVSLEPHRTVSRTYGRTSNRSSGQTGRSLDALTKHIRESRNQLLSIFNNILFTKPVTTGNLK